jgi:hypothetical protein
MMLDSIWPESNGSNKPLPAPNVIVARSGTPPDQLSPEAVKGILVNPIYTGVGPFPRLVEDAAWVEWHFRALRMPCVRSMALKASDDVFGLGPLIDPRASLGL